MRAKCPACGFVCTSIDSWYTNSKLAPDQVMHQFRCPRCHTRFRKATVKKEESRVWE